MSDSAKRFLHQDHPVVVLILVAAALVTIVVGWNALTESGGDSDDLGPSSDPTVNSTVVDEDEPPEPLDEPESPEEPWTVQIADGIRYELTESEYSNTGYTAWFRATNQSGDDRVCLRFSTSLIDSNGDQHQVTERISTDHRYQFDCVYFEAPSRIPRRFGLRFETVPASVEQIPRLTINLRRTSLTHGSTLIYEDIPVPFAAEEVAPSADSSLASR